MIAIALTFPAGRYHATPWGRHVNEGAVEWPPSPWRLLRSLVAVWKRTLSDEPQERVEPILRALAAPPRFALPPASTGHTRHYMPWFKKGPGDRTKVFDAFVALAPDSPLVACWPGVDLEPLQRELLARLLANLNFLGRAESWCEARLIDGAEAVVFGDSTNCAALADGETPAPRDELVRTLCPGDAAFVNDSFFTNKEKKEGKTSVTERVKTVEYDPDWHLAAETLWLHNQKWSDPPGSVWVSYTRPRDCFEIKPAPRKARPTNGLRPHAVPQIVRFALDSAVLPQVTETLPIAEAARRALIFRLTDVRGCQHYLGDWSRQKHKVGMQPVLLHSVLSGKDEHCKPLTGHTHAYFLPTDEDNDGRIDHLTVVARAGFDSDEMRAMDCLREIRPWGRDNVSHPLRVLMLGYGQLDEYHPSFLAPCRELVSATPYIATRHAKTRGRDRIDLASPQERADFLRTDLLSQIRHVCADLDDDALAQITITPVWDSHGAFHMQSHDNRHELRPIQFKRFRSKPDDDGGRRLAGAFRMILPLEVQGPMVLGWSSHFGMGLFVPAVSA